MDYFKDVLIVAIISAVVSAAMLGGYALVTSSHALGSQYDAIFQVFTGGLAVGDPGSSQTPKATKVGFFKVGTCNPTFSGTSLVATSSGLFFCTGLTGVKAGDNVQVTLPSGARSGATGGYFSVIDGYATTTDSIGFDLANMTGAATSSFKQATTSVQYRVWRISTNY